MNAKLLGCFGAMAVVGVVAVGCGDSSSSGGSSSTGGSGGAATSGTTVTGATSSTGTKMTTSSTTGSTVSGSTSSTGGDVCPAPAGDAADTCANACAALYDCGALTCPGAAAKNCAGFSGQAPEKTAFVGDDKNGCIATCNSTPLLKNLVDLTDCGQTIENVSGASPQFKDVCDNGFSGTTGATGSTGAN